MKKLYHFNLVTLVVTLFLAGCAAPSNFDLSQHYNVNYNDVEKPTNPEQTKEIAKVDKIVKNVRPKTYIGNVDPLKELTLEFIGPHAEEYYDNKNSKAIVEICRMNYNLAKPEGYNLSAAIKGEFGSLQAKVVQRLTSAGQNSSGVKLVYFMDDNSFRRLAQKYPETAELCYNRIVRYVGVDPETGKSLKAQDRRAYDFEPQVMIANFLRNAWYYKGIIADASAGKNVVNIAKEKEAEIKNSDVSKSANQSLVLSPP